MAQSFKLLEAVTFAGNERHDAATGMVHGIKLLGLNSKNGKTYKREAIREAFDKGLFNRPTYIDHPPGEADERGIRERFGRPVNIRLSEQGELYADFRYNPEHSYAKEFAWLVDNDPDGIGMSLNGAGRGKKLADGTKLVESITHVKSFDLVDDPATVMGLFEQTENDMAGELGGADPAGVDTAVAPDAGGGDFRASVAALAQTLVNDASMPVADIRSKLMTLLKLIDDEAAKEGDESSKEPPDETAMMEQLRTVPVPAVRKAVRKLDEINIREQAKKRGLDDKALTPTFVGQLLRSAADPKAVEALIADRAMFLREQTGKPRSTDPTARTPPEPPPTFTDPAAEKKSLDGLVTTYFG